MLENCSELNSPYVRNTGWQLGKHSHLIASMPVRRPSACWRHPPMEPFMADTDSPTRPCARIVAAALGLITAAGVIGAVLALDVHDDHAFLQAQHATAPPSTHAQPSVREVDMVRNVEVGGRGHVLHHPPRWIEA